MNVLKGSAELQRSGAAKAGSGRRCSRQKKRYVIVRRGELENGQEKLLYFVLNALNDSLRSNARILGDIKSGLDDHLVRGAGATIRPESSVDYIVTNVAASAALNKNSLTTSDGVEPVQVELCVRFLKLGEIDTIKEQFQAEVLIEATWKEPALRKDEADQFDPKTNFNPSLFIENALGDLKQELSYKITTGGSRGAFVPTVHEIRKVKGTFVENLELYEFPVDVQDLSITIKSSKSTSHVELSESSVTTSSINTETFIDQQEWKLHEHVETFKRTSNSDTSDIKHPALSFTVHASRRPGYFYWNVYFLIFFITIMIFATFSVALNLPQNRLQLAFTLLLTAVTFKFVVNRSLPPISYLTSLDKYVLASMVFLCVICAWHALIAAIYDAAKPIVQNSTTTTTTTAAVDNVVVLYDRYALAFFAAVYVVLHVVFVLWMYLFAYKRRREMFIKDRLYWEQQAKRRTRASASSRRNGATERKIQDYLNARSEAASSLATSRTDLAATGAGAGAAHVDQSGLRRMLFLSASSNRAGQPTALVYETECRVLPGVEEAVVLKSSRNDKLTPSESVYTGLELRTINAINTSA